MGVMQTPRHKGFVNLLGKIESDIKSKNRLSAPGKLLPRLNLDKIESTEDGIEEEEEESAFGQSDQEDSFADELLEIDKDFSLKKKKSSPQNSSTPNDEIEQIIRKLWGLLDTTGDHAAIVQLLMKFDFLKPKIFGDVIVSDLINENRDIKRRAVDKFAIFWKLTTPRSHRRGATVASSQQLINDQAYKPFQPDHERKKEMGATTIQQEQQQ